MNEKVRVRLVAPSSVAKQIFVSVSSDEQTRVMHVKVLVVFCGGRVLEHRCRSAVREEKEQFLVGEVGRLLERVGHGDLLVRKRRRERSSR